MAITIFLRKIKKFKQLEYLIDLIARGKSKEITLDYLTCLKKILPDKMDVDEIQTYCKENEGSPVAAISKLAEADQFIKLLSDIPFYELRINLMTFLEEFDDCYSKLDKPLKVYSTSSQIVLNNTSLKLLFGLILASGNFLNSNSYRGNACGFKVNILTQLLEVKTNKPSVTLLHVVIEHFEKILSLDENFKNNNLDFLNDLKEIGSVLK
jgi:hypothetical protein